MDAIDHRKGGQPGASEGTVLGPFHVAGVPEMAMGEDICRDGKGQPMRVPVRIPDTSGSPVANARIDVWQADDEGFHDVPQKGIQPDFNLRGVVRTGPDGRTWFRRVKRRIYPIPDDSPVGGLLTALGRHPFRPPHLHYIVEAEGFETLVTHIFNPDIASDAVFGVKETQLAGFKPVTDPTALAEAGFATPFLDVEFDFVLARAGQAGTPSTAALE